MALVIVCQVTYIITMSIQAIIKKIDPKKNYNLSNIKSEGLFPWAAHIRTIGKIVQQDLDGDNMLKTTVTFEGNGKRYVIKGNRLVLFINKFGEGFMMSVKKSSPTK